MARARNDDAPRPWAAWQLATATLLAPPLAFVAVVAIGIFASKQMTAAAGSTAVLLACACSCVAGYGGYFMGQLDGWKRRRVPSKIQGTDELMGRLREANDQRVEQNERLRQTFDIMYGVFTTLARDSCDASVLAVANCLVHIREAMLSERPLPSEELDFADRSSFVRGPCDSPPPSGEGGVI